MVSCLPRGMELKKYVYFLKYWFHIRNTGTLWHCGRLNSSVRKSHLHTNVNKSRIYPWSCLQNNLKSPRNERLQNRAASANVAWLPVRTVLKFRADRDLDSTVLGFIGTHKLTSGLCGTCPWFRCIWESNTLMVSLLRPEQRHLRCSWVWETVSLSIHKTWSSVRSRIQSDCDTHEGCVQLFAILNLLAAHLLDLKKKKKKGDTHTQMMHMPEILSHRKQSCSQIVFGPNPKSQWTGEIISCFLSQS